MPEPARPLDAQSGTLEAEHWLPAVYDELRRLAAYKMSGHDPGQTLQPTALVHEAWMRLAAGGNGGFKSREHFFHAAARAMRQILIDRARGRAALKRGAGVHKLNLDEVDVVARANDETLLVLDDALEELSRDDPQCAELVKLRFFAGLTNEEAAQALGISERTAKRYWTFARAWLYRELSCQR